jgi:hypothetical protein
MHSAYVGGLSYVHQRQCKQQSSSIHQYNEDEIGFTRTMHGVMRNISHFCSRTKSRTWGRVLLVHNILRNTLLVNTEGGQCIQRTWVDFLTSISDSLDDDLKFKGAEKGIVPCQVIFCLKEHNKKKLNSLRNTLLVNTEGGQCIQRTWVDFLTSISDNANNNRETELFICITMYNEDEIGFTRTMHGVMRNISHL